MRLWSIALLSLLVSCLHPPRAASPTHFRVMTWNIRSGNGNLERTGETIRALKPDLVGLQEVDVHWAERSAFVDQADSLGAMLHMRVGFARIYRLPADSGRPPREFGVALLSRFPITRFTNDTLTRLSTQAPHPVPTPMPGLLDAIVDVRGAPIRVLNTHLDYRRDAAVWQTQVAEMLRELDASPLPTIVLGDMNARPDAPELAPLLQRLRDAWSSAAGSGVTYPADAPNERIDYILVTDRFQVRAASVPVTDASDHRPVVADVELARP